MELSLKRKASLPDLVVCINDKKSKQDYEEKYNEMLNKFSREYDNYLEPILVKVPKEEHVKFISKLNESITCNISLGILVPKNLGLKHMTIVDASKNMRWFESLSTKSNLFKNFARIISNAWSIQLTFVTCKRNRKTNLPELIRYDRWVPMKQSTSKCTIYISPEMKFYYVPSKVVDEYLSKEKSVDIDEDYFES